MISQALVVVADIGDDAPSVIVANLDAIIATDFSDCATEQVGMGTGVVLNLADGTTKKYWILGEWDRDEQLGIIPRGSRVAEALLGHKRGDPAVVPTTGDAIHCEIVDITSVDDEMKAWIRHKE